MGQCVRNLTITGKVLSFEGMLGRTYNLHFDDVDDALRQGDRKGTKPAVTTQVTLDPKTGKATYDTTPQAFTTGTKHTAHFVDAQNGHVTLPLSFIAG